MFTLLMANIQGETLICVSNSDREGTRTQLHLQDRDTVVRPAQVCPVFPGLLGGFTCDEGPRASPGPPWRPCHAGRGQGWAFCACGLFYTESNGGLFFSR